jgi:hypothetical protein
MFLFLWYPFLLPRAVKLFFFLAIHRFALFLWHTAVGTVGDDCIVEETPKR